MLRTRSPGNEPAALAALALLPTGTAGCDLFGIGVGVPDEARVEVTGPASELIYVIVSKEFQRGVDEEGEPVTTVFTQDATLNDASLEYSRIF